MEINRDSPLQLFVNTDKILCEINNLWLGRLYKARKELIPAMYMTIIGTTISQERKLQRTKRKGELNFEPFITT